MKAVAIVSGGLDSVTMAYYVKFLGYDLHILSFDYGQRHRGEIAYARACAEELGAEAHTIDLTSMGALLRGSSLTDKSIAVPEGHYAAPNMASTVVPNRNAVMLAIAFSIAVAEKADRVCIGVHGGDHFIYPDCRPEFLAAFAGMEQYAIGTTEGPRIFAPFSEVNKTAIVLTGALLGVPFERTWSCYKGGDVHCGVCGTCVERKEAFFLAGVEDPTKYLK